MNWRAAILALGAVAAATGCSFMTVDGPPSSVPPQGPVLCDSTATLPMVVDVAVGTVTALVVFAIFYSANIDESRPDRTLDTEERVVPPLFAAGAAAPWYVSAVIGHRRAGKCRYVKAVTGR